MGCPPACMRAGRASTTGSCTRRCSASDGAWQGPVHRSPGARQALKTARSAGIHTSRIPRRRWCVQRKGAGAARVGHRTQRTHSPALSRGRLAPRQEPHIMHKFEGEFYGAHLEVAAVAYLRPEQDYPSLGASCGQACPASLGGTDRVAASPFPGRRAHRGYPQRHCGRGAVLGRLDANGGRGRNGRSRVVEPGVPAPMAHPRRKELLCDTLLRRKAGSGGQWSHMPPPSCWSRVGRSQLAARLASC